MRRFVFVTLLIWANVNVPMSWWRNFFKEIQFHLVRHLLNAKSPFMYRWRSSLQWRKWLSPIFVIYSHLLLSLLKTFSSSPFSLISLFPFSWIDGNNNCLSEKIRTNKGKLWKKMARSPALPLPLKKLLMI